MVTLTGPVSTSFVTSTFNSVAVAARTGTGVSPMLTLVVVPGRRKLGALDRKNSAALTAVRLQRIDARADEPGEMEVEPIAQLDRRLLDWRRDRGQIELRWSCFPCASFDSGGLLLP